MHFDINNIVSFCSMSSMAVMCIIIVLVPKPERAEWKRFRHALHFFLLACISIILSNIPETFMPTGDSAIVRAITLGVSSLQALLFSALTIIMLNPKSKFISSLPYQLVGLLVASVALVISAIYSPVKVFSWTLIIAVVGYLMLCGFYTKVFWDVYRKTQHQLEVFYDDDMHNRIRWMRRLFFIALSIGVIAAVVVLVDRYYAVFDMLAVFYYAYLLACLLRYIITAGYLLKAVEGEMLDERLEILDERRERRDERGEMFEERQETRDERGEMIGGEEIQMETNPVLSIRDRRLELNLARWVERKEFVKTDVGVEEIARQLGTTYGALSHYFSDVKSTTFRNWRTQLRIDEAKRMMKEQQDLSIKEIGALVGFNDRANFYRSFQKSENMTPSEFKERCVSL